MPDTFARSPDGYLYITNGIDKPVRWDGITDAIEVSGVEAPSEAVVIAGSGVGDIFGTIYGFARFVDRLGRVSNMSPIGQSVAISGVSGNITDATNTGPIVVTAVAHGRQTGDQVEIKDVLGNTAANGVWTVTNVDADSFSLDGSTGNGDYRSDGTGTWNTGASTITYTNLPTTDDPAIVKREVYRTKIGDPNTVYLDISSETFLATELT